MALEIYPRLLAGFGMLLFTKSGHVFDLILPFLSNKQVYVVLYAKFSQEYPVNDRVPQGPTLYPAFFLLYINYLPDSVICNIAIYADDTTVYYKYEQASDLCQELEVASELEFYVQDTVYWGRKWLVVCNFLIGITLVDVHLN